jgi:hypothetical protein
VSSLVGSRIGWLWSLSSCPRRIGGAAWPLNSEFNGHWRIACPYQSYADMRHSSLRLRPQLPPNWGRIFEGDTGAVAHDDQLRRASKVHFIGIDGSITHIRLVSISLSLGTLWNGLSFSARAEAVSLPSGTTPVRASRSCVFRIRRTVTPFYVTWRSCFSGAKQDRSQTLFSPDRVGN